jgi:hypothetical protein
MLSGASGTPCMGADNEYHVRSSVKMTRSAYSVRTKLPESIEARCPPALTLQSHQRVLA